MACFSKYSVYNLSNRRKSTSEKRVEIVKHNIINVLTVVGT